MHLNENDVTIGDLCHSSSDDVEEASFQNILKRDINILLSKLTPKEAMIIKLRYGIDDKNNKCFTLQEASKKVGLSRERVRQIKKNAIVKMIRLTKTPSFSHLNEY